MVRADDGGDGPYDGARRQNTDSATGRFLPGDGVKANLDDLTDYSGTLDRIQTDFTPQALATSREIQTMIADAFHGGDAPSGFEWNLFFSRATAHNLLQLQTFHAGIATGIRNTAMAAQTVANSFGNTDERSAATLGSIDFAFGDRSKAPAGFPVDRVQTFDEAVAAREAAGGGAPTGAPPASAADVALADTAGGSSTVTVRLPDGRTMVTVTQPYGSTGPTTRGGSVRTVYIDGRLQTVTRVSTVGNRTTTTVTGSVYDAKGRHVRDQIVSDTSETVTSAGGPDVRTDRRTVTYSYDEAGRRTGQSETGSHTTIGPQPTQADTTDAQDDPAKEIRDRILDRVQRAAN